MNRPIFFGGAIRSPLSWWRDRHEQARRPRDEGAPAPPPPAREPHLAGMIHELRNPLAAIAGLVNLLLEENLEESQQKSLLTRVAATVAAMDVQIKNASDLYLVDQVRLRPNRRLSRLNQLIEESIARCAPAAQVKHLEISTTFADLPQIEVDPLHVDRIVSNLLLNAIRRTPARGRVSLVTARSADQLVLTITDEGAPAAADKLSRFFDRAHDPGNPSASPDLGCYVARLLVEVDGGSIDAINEAGRGVAVVVSFPLTPPLPAADAGA